MNLVAHVESYPLFGKPLYLLSLLRYLPSESAFLRSLLVLYTEVSKYIFTDCPFTFRLLPPLHTFLGVAALTLVVGDRIGTLNLHN